MYEGPAGALARLAQEHIGRAGARLGQAGCGGALVGAVATSAEAELSASGRLLLATDERGGGVTPPGATCSAEIDSTAGNGGIHAYRTNALSTTGPGSPEDAWRALR